MTPMFFGETDRRLFGIYEPPTYWRSDALRIVLSYPWGPEYLHAHRSVRRLAAMLSESGHHIMRFDYHGTGDSGGDMALETLAAWESDLETAVAELRQLAGGHTVVLIGLRLGAVIAANVAARLGDQVERLALWDPIVDGVLYLGQLEAACHASYLMSGGPISRKGKLGGGLEVLGYPLSAAIADDIRNIDLHGIVRSLPKRTLIAVSGDSADMGRIQYSLMSDPASPFTVAHYPGLPCWAEDWPINISVVPFELLNHIQEWIG